MPTDYIQLLAPARNREIAEAAILAGADAVYIGAPEFGAREDASNSIEDIAEVCKIAHLYGARVCAACNTILKDFELRRAETMAWKLYEAGVDSIIVQDMAFLKMRLPPLRLHASTQCHISNVEKAKFLEACGFDTIVLARELSLGEISEIANAVSCNIECFVHGALCVSYSGQCYLSWAIGGRSGNRGACAQPCRMLYSLQDSSGKSISPDAHYLSLRDMNRSASIGEMLDAGVRIFKIEGRLKDASYVKNITAYYRKIIDSQISSRNLKRLSNGQSILNFEPDPVKTFSREFCEYHLHGVESGTANFSAPNSRGEFIGIVEKSEPGAFYFNNASKILKNGDGLVFETPQTPPRIFGAGVSGVNGARVLVGYPAMRLPKGTRIWRNKSAEFEKLAKLAPARKIEVSISLRRLSDSLRFEMSQAGAPEIFSEILLSCGALIKADNPQTARSAISANLSKLGSTPFKCTKIDIEIPDESIPYLKISDINSIRRNLAEKLESKILREYDISRRSFVPRKPDMEAAKHFAAALPCDYRANCLNSLAREFYSDVGVNITEYSPESGRLDMRGRRVMRTRLCILRELGICKTLGKFPPSIKEPLFLKSESANLRLRFDCKSCAMDIFYE